jgi:hypothetical protein
MPPWFGLLPVFQCYFGNINTFLARQIRFACALKFSGLAFRSKIVRGKQQKIQQIFSFFRGKNAFFSLFSL